MFLTVLSRWKSALFRKPIGAESGEEPGVLVLHRVGRTIVAEELGQWFSTLLML